MDERRSGGAFRTGRLAASLLALMLVLAPPAGAQSVPDWQPNRAYAAGDLATYKGVTYQALRPTGSNSLGTPAALPGQWQSVNMKGASRCAAAPQAPTGLTSSNLGSSGVTLSWKAPKAPKNCKLGNY